MVISRTIRRFCPASVNKLVKSVEMGTAFIPFITPILNFFSNKNSRNRILVVCALSIFFLVYLFPGLLSETKKRLVMTSSATDCLSPFLADFESELQSSNVRITTYSSDQALSPLINGGHHNRPDVNKFNSLGFVGNGRYGFILQGGGKLLIGNVSDKTLSLEAQKDFNPIHFAHVHSTTAGGTDTENGEVPGMFAPSAKFKPSSMPFSGALIADFLNGVVTSMECFRVERKCVTIEHSYMFHRRRSNLFLEKFVFRNELTHSVSIAVDSFMHGCSSRAEGGAIAVGGGTKTTVGGKLFCRVEGNIRHSQFSNLVILQQIVEEPVRITAQSKSTVYVLSAISHSVAKSLDAINDELTKMLEEVLVLPSESLINSHKSDWNKIWTTGINVGPSKEENAPSSTAVNETLYHILSSIEEPLLQSADRLTETDQKNLQQLIRNPDHTSCFNGIPNIDAFQLWSVPTRTFEDLKDAIDVWHLTLKKYGCSKLLTAGLSGLYEAVVLSVFALQFSEDHLALRAQPTFFHRNMSVRHVTYRDCSLNLGVSLLPDGHAELTLASEQCSQGFHLYACDAGCTKPQLLGSRELKFAVMETVPHTPILYISESMSHLTDLKRTIHFRSIHKFYSKEFFQSKTKPYKALPTAFWVVVAFVIVAFHIFLVILLYREYWVGGSSGTGAGGGEYSSQYYDYPSSVRTTGPVRSSSGSSSSRGSAGSFISNYSVPKFTTHLYSKSNSFKK